MKLSSNPHHFVVVWEHPDGRRHEEENHQEHTAEDAAYYSGRSWDATGWKMLRVDRVQGGERRVQIGVRQRCEDAEQELAGMHLTDKSVIEEATAC